MRVRKGGWRRKASSHLERLLQGPEDKGLIWSHMLSLGKLLEPEDGGGGRMKRRGRGEKEGEGRKKELSTRMPGYFMLEAKVECIGHVPHCLRGPGGDCP